MVFDDILCVRSKRERQRKNRQKQRERRFFDKCLIRTNERSKRIIGVEPRESARVTVTTHFRI